MLTPNMSRALVRIPTSEHSLCVRWPISPLMCGSIEALERHYHQTESRGAPPASAHAARLCEAYGGRAANVRGGSSAPASDGSDQLRPQPRAWVAQKYIEQPLLYHGRKFDLRIFALIESALGTELGFSLYAHKEGYGRTSSEPYSLGATHASMHLTNYAVQKVSKHASKHEKGNCVSFHEIDDHLQQTSDVDFWSVAVPEMHALLADAVLAAREVFVDALATAATPMACYRDLVAFDLILDRSGRAPPRCPNPESAPGLASGATGWLPLLAALRLGPESSAAA